MLLPVDQIFIMQKSSHFFLPNICHRDFPNLQVELEVVFWNSWKRIRQESICSKRTVRRGFFPHTPWPPFYNFKEHLSSQGEVKLNMRGSWQLELYRDLGRKAGRLVLILFLFEVLDFFHCYKMRGIFVIVLFAQCSQTFLCLQAQLQLHKGWIKMEPYHWKDYGCPIPTQTHNSTQKQD